MENLLHDKTAVSTYFGLPYNQANLEAILNASMRSTLDYIRATGVRPFKIPRPTPVMACSPLTSLETASQEHQRLWNSFAPIQRDSRASGEAHGHLTGLYFEDCDEDCQDHDVVQPTILIDEAADRWALIHEMMHHLFNVARKNDPNLMTVTTLTRELAQSTERARKDLDTFQLAPSAQALMSFASEMHDLTHLGYKSLLFTDFEEFAADGILIDEYAAGRLTHVSARSAAAALRYMKKARQQGLTKLQKALPLLGFIQEAGRELGASEAIVKAEATERFINEVASKSENWIQTSEQALRAGSPSCCRDEGRKRQRAL